MGTFETRIEKVRKENLIRTSRERTSTFSADTRKIDRASAFPHQMNKDKQKSLCEIGVFVRTLVALDAEADVDVPL